jgi:TrfA protein
MGDSMSDPERIDAALESLHSAMKANPRTRDPEPHKQPRATIIQLPLWPEPVRGAPNALLRSAFFAGIHSKKRKELGTRLKPDQPKQGVTIAAQEGIRISYAGDQLNQYDADVFFEALHRARHHPLETECIFTGYNFLKAIRRQDGPREYEDLNNSLRRLREGTVDLEWKINGRHYIFTGSLISSYVREKNSKLYKLIFAKEIRDLFAPACWTQLEWEERMTLKGKPLAQWLHSFFCSHAAPFPLSAAYLHHKSGSARTLLKYFRRDLKDAFATLEKTLGWQAIWNADLVTLKRPLSASQIHHLNQKKPRLKPRRRKARTAFNDLLAGS